MLTCALYVNGQTGKSRKLYPVNESSRDASLKAFITELERAIERRDAKFIIGILDPNIKNSFGGDDGIEEFKGIWKIEERDSRFWDEVSIVLKLGGTFERGDMQNSPTYVAPYIFSRFPRNLDAFENAAIVGQNVRARARPQATAPVVATLSYDVVRTDAESSVPAPVGEGYEWVKITTPSGKSAFVQGKYIRSPVDYRAFFTKRKGRWMLTIFVAGD